MTAILIADIARRLEACSPDESRVMEVVLRRLERRRAKAGPLVLAANPDIFGELNGGLIDSVIACTAMTLRAEDLRHEQERRGMLGPDDEQAELERWARMDRRTPAPLEDAVPVAIEPGEGPTNRSSR